MQQKIVYTLVYRLFRERKKDFNSGGLKNVYPIVYM